MEVILIHMNNTILKTDLWAERIHAFQESGLSRKDWHQQNEVPQSTLSYWIRKFQSKTTQAASTTSYDTPPDSSPPPSETPG